MAHRLLFIPGLLLVLSLHFAAGHAAADAGDVVFVTQVPIASDFANLVSTFANHNADPQSAPRGGDLWIRYADGSLRNLTQAAGYGMTGHQGANAIAVRDPAVHWSGQKVLFSMVIGSPSQYQTPEYRWQLYEITGLGKNQTPVITKVQNQPPEFNNVMGCYATDDRILFASDRPRNGAAHLYPQRDEYESTDTNSGLWSLNPGSGELRLLDHAPSGVFHPLVDSFGRVIYTRWDHLQRDQQAGGLTDYGAFNFADETAGAQRSSSQFEFFPEPRSERERVSPTINLHTFNHFFPWQINDDGTEHETMNHVGRHELHSYFDRTFNDDPNLEEYYGQLPRFNQNSAENFFHLREHPLEPGNFYAIDAPEFGTHAAGQIVKLNGAPSVRADRMTVTYVTHRDTSRTDDTPSVNHSGLYRNPLPTSTGQLYAVHTAETRQDTNVGTGSAPASRYQFRLQVMAASGAVQVAGAFLTPGIAKTLTYYDPDQLVSISTNLWELQPVELVARTRPQARTGQLESPEQAVFQEEAVDATSFKSFMADRGLALIVTRNVTSRDSLDVQQPFNLRVFGTNTQKIPLSGRIYDVAHLQIFQGDQVRGYGGTTSPQEGRRVLPIPAHDGFSYNAPNPNGPASSVAVAPDGSMAAFVPAQRALTWQLTDQAGAGVVRERYWLTFQPGEVRVCASCHGLSGSDQLGASVPQNKPEALRQLLRAWKANGGNPNPPAPTPSPTPTPPSPPGDPGTGGSPGIQVITQMNRATSLTDMLVSKKNATIVVSGLPPGSAIELRASIDGVACPLPLRPLFANANGQASLRGKSPATKRLVGVALQASAAGSTADKAVPLLSGKRKDSPKPLSDKDRRKICDGLRKLR